MTKNSKYQLETLRHSTAHLMAAAVCELFPDTKIAIGPAIKDGFYYDFDSPTSFTQDDLLKIEDKMYELIQKDDEYIKIEMSKSEAIEYFKSRNEKYKLELLNEIPDENVTLYKTGNFVDLCRGPHIQNTGQIKYFKLLSVAGAYWRGDERREQLQRIYGTAFFSGEDLDEYLKRIEEAKKRDHRKLGRELEIFSLHEEVGGGLVHWHPRGAMLKNIIENYWKDLHLKKGYQLVSTPHIASEEIYRISGHLENYAELMYAPMEIEGRPYRIKPMNCPGHIMIYKTKLHSYRELPLRYAEIGAVYRFEKGGVLHGLLRVRGFSIDDAHIFVTPEGVLSEVRDVLSMATEFLKTFGFSEFEIYLATRPKERFVGTFENWEMAQRSLKDALDRSGLRYEVDEGGGAFYGPKIDIKIKDCLNRLWQCSTIQFDFNLPERFDLTYIDSEGKRSRPFMIHRALMGSVERFIGVLTEHYAGKFPFWLAPEQVVVMNISEKQLNYAREVYSIFVKNNIRATLDLRNEKIGYKIREATLQKIPFLVIVGDKEKETATISVRSQNGENLGAFSINDFIAYLKKL